MKERLKKDEHAIGRKDLRGDKGDLERALVGRRVNDATNRVTLPPRDARRRLTAKRSYMGENIGNGEGGHYKREM